jgi:hypothetical protein
MLGCKALDNPLEVNVKLGESNDSHLVDKGRYQRLVDRLIYSSHTRPNIAYVGKCGESVYALATRASYGSCLSNPSLLEILTR